MLRLISLRMRLAILEDDAAQAETLSNWLTASGHDCHVYPAGKSLLKDAGRESFDLFVLDWPITPVHMCLPPSVAAG